ncbi:MAG: GTP-binding protein [Tumebacillaceae bacterium]
MAKQIPIYILTGFLGAGKTTLLKRLLCEMKVQGRRPAVLMNEFGAASVDTLLVEETAVPVVDLIEGCVCCSVKGSLTQAMEELLVQHAPDVVFLEATGVAIPLEIVDALLDPPLAGRVQVAGVLACVDATQFPLHFPSEFEQTVLQRTMIEQVRHADVLLMTKTDVARPDRRFALESVLRGLNARALLVKAVKGDVDAGQVLAVRRLAPVREKKWKRVGAMGPVRKMLREKKRESSYGALQTLHVPFSGAVDADRLYELLYALPEGVLRAKGFFANADTGETYEFHYVPRTPMMGPVRTDVPGFAVVIGEGLDEEELRRKLKACQV